MVNPKVQEMLDLAAIDVKRLSRASTCRGARKAWTDFLEHSNRAFNRLEAHAKKTGQLPKYKSMLRDEVWPNDLTKYMRVARNAHEHGIMDTQVDDPYNERFVFPNGQIFGAPTVIGMNDAGEEVYMAAVGPAEFSGSPEVRRVSLKPGIMLVSILDRFGEVVSPPHVAVLEAEDEAHCVAVARTYLEWLISKVTSFASV